MLGWVRFGCWRCVHGFRCHAHGVILPLAPEDDKPAAFILADQRGRVTVRRRRSRPIRNLLLPGKHRRARRKAGPGGLSRRPAPARRAGSRSSDGPGGWQRANGLETPDRQTRVDERATRQVVRYSVSELVRVRIRVLASSLLRRLSPAAAELTGLYDEPCHHQEHLHGRRRRSRRLHRRRAPTATLEHARPREAGRAVPGESRPGRALGPPLPRDGQGAVLGRSHEARPAKAGVRQG